MNSKNILTGAVAFLAVALAIVVVLLQTGVFEKKPEEEETVIETKVVEISETNEHGEIEYLTMLETYVAKVSSEYTYPKKPTTKPPKTEPQTVLFVEQESQVPVLDENGNPVLDENGVPVTQVITITVPYNGEESTTEPTTQYVPKTEFNVVTNAFGRPQKDENGNPLTQVVTVEPIPPEHQDIWGYESNTEETRFPEVNLAPQRDSNLANSIITQIQADRVRAGLGYLTVSEDLNAAAREDSHLRALNMHAEQSSGGYSFDTSYGGSGVYNDINASLSSKLLSAETTEIGVGVMKLNGKYFTTVVIR